MIKLNLETKYIEQEIIKQYLEENVSETLADKINNGVKIEKDGKTLINKKDLNTFLIHASEEARKLANKGVNFACIKDETIYAWAIHYFEEDTIEGVLFNEDGTEYKAVSQKQTAPQQIEIPKPKKENNQQSFFDMLDLSTNSQENEEKLDKNEEIVEKIEENKEKLQKVEPINVDIKNQTFDKFLLKTISVLLDGKVKLQ